MDNRWICDTLVYHLLDRADATGGNGHDTWTDFNVAQGDKIDISELLIGWNDSTSNINDFVKVDHTSDGSTVLSYSLNADVNVQNITHKEVFSYTLAGRDGTLTSHSFTIELHPTINGTGGNDTLTSSAYDDTITAGAGATSLLAESSSAEHDASGSIWADSAGTHSGTLTITNALGAETTVGAAGMTQVAGEFGVLQVSASGSYTINSSYGTLTLDARGNYTYALKAGLNIDTLPATDTFTYSVRDASGTVTSATLTVTLHNGPAATLFAANTNLSVLPTTTVSTVSDYTTLAVTTAATVTGNLLANDTSSIAGTVPAGVAVTTAGGATVAGTGNTVYGSVNSIGVAANYSLNLYTQLSNGSWQLVSSQSNYISSLLSIGTIRGGNVTYSNLSTGNYAVVVGARVVATNDVSEVDYGTTQATINNGTVNSSHTALLTLGVGSLLGASVLNNGNAYIFNVGQDDFRTVTLTGSGEVGATVTVRDASGVTLGTTTVGSGGSWSVALSTAQTTGATLSVTQSDRAGNVSPSASLLGAMSVTVGTGGSWSFTTAALSNGAHTLSTTVTDPAGNVSSTNVATTITVDTVPPAAVSGLLINSAGTSVSPQASVTLRVDTVAPVASTLTITDDAGSAPVTLTSGAFTRDTTPTLSGTAEAGALVTIFDGTTALGNGVTNDSTPLLSGSGEAGARVSVYDGTTLLGTATVGGSGSWSFITPALGNGPHTLNVTQTDAAGNVSGSWSFTPGTALSEGSHTFSITATDAAGNVSSSISSTAIIDTTVPVAVTGLTLANNNGSTAIAIPKAVSITVDTVAPAAPTLVVTNDINNTTVVNGGATRDSTPTLSGTAEANSLVIVRDGTTVLGSVTASSDATPTLSGTAEASAVVTVYDGSTVLGSVVAGSDGAWSFTPAALSNGVHSLSTTVRDAAGNVSPATPSFVSPVLSEGSHTLNVTQTDAAGNVSPPASITLTVDTVAPAAVSNLTITDDVAPVTGPLANGAVTNTVAPGAVTGLAAANNNGSTAIAIPNNSVTSDSTPLLTGSGEAGARVTILDGNVALGTAIVSSNGS
ncbi:hypothetical protein CRX72_03370 [Pantoea sp. BRM17]|nr:hypothetical protein CRX72_03370 [Pantoea sp. BRM17]